MSDCFEKIQRLVNKIPDVEIIRNEDNFLIISDPFFGYDNIQILIRDASYHRVHVSIKLASNIARVNDLERAAVLTELLQLTSKHNVMLVIKEGKSLGIATTMRCFDDTREDKISEELQAVFNILRSFLDSYYDTILELFSRNNVPYASIN